MKSSSYVVLRGCIRPIYINSLTAGLQECFRCDAPQLQRSTVNRGLCCHACWHATLLDLVIYSTAYAPGSYNQPTQFEVVGG